MHTLNFDILIQAPRPLVWATMLEPHSYTQWTSAFCAGSQVEGEWQSGQPLRFTNGQGCGLVAEVAELRLHEWLSIRHLGVIVDGVEDTHSEAVRAWAPCYENYQFSDAGGGTRLQISQDCLADYQAMLAECWPRALQQLKTMCEQRHQEG